MLPARAGRNLGPWAISAMCRGGPRDLFRALAGRLDVGAVTAQSGGLMGEPLAEIRTYDELVTALRARVGQLGVACESIDATAGLASRYTCKLLAPVPVREFGRCSLGPLLQCLGVKLILALDDEAAFAKIRSRLVPVKHAGSAMQAMRKPLRRRYFFEEPGAAALARARQLLLQGPYKRKRIARAAAKSRWRNGVGRHTTP